MYLIAGRGCMCHHRASEERSATSVERPNNAAVAVSIDQSESTRLKTERQRDRETERQRDRETERQKDRARADGGDILGRSLQQRSLDQPALTIHTGELHNCYQRNRTVASTLPTVPLINRAIHYGRLGSSPTTTVCPPTNG